MHQLVVDPRRRCLSIAVRRQLGAGALAGSDRPRGPRTIGQVRTGRTIQNPASGERIVLLRTGAETGGRLVEFELHLSPGGRVPTGHLHPEQEERFTVLDGRVRFRLGRRSVIAAVGETVTVFPGVPHSFANAGPAPARLLVEARPALHMEELLETAAELGTLPGPVKLALFLKEFEREVRAPILPRLVASAMRPVAWIGSRLGLDATYRHLRDGTRDHKDDHGL